MAIRIGELARRTGVEPGTLRAWERRFGLLQPVRTTGGQRQYSEADVDRVLTVRRLVLEGLTLSSAVKRVLCGERALPGGETDAQFLREILENLPVGVVVEQQGRTRYANRRMAEMLQCSAGDPLSTPLRECASTSERFSGDVRVVRRDGSTTMYQLNSTLLFGADGESIGRMTSMYDVSDRGHVDLDVRTRDQRMSVVAILGARALAAGTESSLSEDTLLHEIVEVTRRLLGADRTAVTVIGSDNKMVVRASSPDGAPVAPADGGSLAGYTMLAGSVVVVEDVLSERRFDTTSFASGTRSAVAAPVFAPGGPRGALAAECAEVRSFDKSATDFMQSLANVVAVASMSGPVDGSDRMNRGSRFSRKAAVSSFSQIARES